MRNAPSVLYPVGRCAFYARWLILLGLLGVAVLATGAWLARGSDDGGMTTSLMGGGLWWMWLGFAGWSWHRAPVGHLQWDALAHNVAPEGRAGAWRWRSDACQDGALLHRVELMLDLQSRVLLRLRNPDGATSWVWLERCSDPARWDDVRRALVACR